MDWWKMRGTVKFGDCYADLAQRARQRAFPLLPPPASRTPGEPARSAWKRTARNDVLIDRTRTLQAFTNARGRARPYDAHALA